MRFIITAQPGPDSPAPDPNAPLDEALFSAYMKFNEEMHKAGVLVAAEGLEAGRRRRPRRGEEGQARRRGRTVHRVEGTGRRLLHHRSGLAGRSDRVGAALPNRIGLRRRPRDPGADGRIGHPAESARTRAQGCADVERDVLEEAVRVEASPHGPWRRLECRPPPAGSRATRDRRARRPGTPRGSRGA